jgi:hypothetical protein
VVATVIIDCLLCHPLMCTPAQTQGNYEPLKMSVLTPNVSQPQSHHGLPYHFRPSTLSLSLFLSIHRKPQAASEVCKLVNKYIRTKPLSRIIVPD